MRVGSQRTRMELLLDRILKRSRLVIIKRRKTRRKIISKSVKMRMDIVNIKKMMDHSLKMTYWAM